MSDNDAPLQVVPCNLCGATDPRLILDAGAQGSVVRCRRCDLTYTSPRPPSTRGIYESDAYFQSGAPAEHGYASYADDSAVLEPYFLKLVSQLSRRRRSGCLLEVGSAAGFFLRHARQQGFDVTGIELSPGAARQAAERFGLPMITGTLEDAAVDRDSMDVIVLLQTIEHVPDPAATLTRLLELMRPGALLLMTTPNQSSWLARVSRSHWFEYKPPEHLYFFSPRTLRQLLQRAGFCDIEIRRDVHRYPPGWVLDRLARYAPATALLVRSVDRVVPRAILHRWAVPVYYGPMAVWARKRQ